MFIYKLFFLESIHLPVLTLVSLFYSNVRFSKLAFLLQNEKDKIEDALCEMIFADMLKCSIDRPAELVTFTAEQSEAQVIDDWIKNIDQIVDLVDFVSQRIERQEAN